MVKRIDDQKVRITIGDDMNADEITYTHLIDKHRYCITIHHPPAVMPAYSTEAGRAFQSKAATSSRGSRTAFPRQAGHPARALGPASAQDPFSFVAPLSTDPDRRPSARRRGFASTLLSA